MSLTRQEWERRARELRIETRAFIDGHYRAAVEGDTFDCLSPIDGRSLGQVASCGPADADLAVETRCGSRRKRARLRAAKPLALTV